MSTSICIHQVTSIEIEPTDQNGNSSTYVRGITIKTTNGDFELSLFAHGPNNTGENNEDVSRQQLALNI